MIKLDRNYYLIHNTASETVTHYDDPYRLVAWLAGKRTQHLIVHVIKGDKARLLTVDVENPTDFQKKLLSTMNSL